MIVQVRNKWASFGVIFVFSKEVKVSRLMRRDCAELILNIYNLAPDPFINQCKQLLCCYCAFKSGRYYVVSLASAAVNTSVVSTLSVSLPSLL